ncbi:phosphoribosyl 1,2-cyclic phosphodiesterase [Halanaerobium saccharolyticum]|uniref:Phosphoribosyl 1,2-cyclic phosphodiesterase n=1 Tax=Halanaerobium saccharolyticum TaxID=43595 RepID=A0A4R6M431_9FIRM|nr:MBL fold metallo-hydrolase [Halanaerobium saccharolyticum]TDO95250.1 phosphoribosyl 1,2-cyclic phosphodiesterase [Halanaerobium saccharolyticum]
MSKDFAVKFWGVRGSCPTPGKQTIKFGGNTPCIEITIGDKTLIMDAGTGIRELGLNLQQKNKELNIDIFITHTHWDHIQGFPFFSPLYVSSNTFTIYGYKGIDKILAGQFQKSFFPVQFEDLKSKIEFKILANNNSIMLNDEIRVTTMLTNHDGKNLAYKLESDHKTFCYLGDLEHSVKSDSALINFVKDADLIIYDAKYTEEEYLNSKSGRGHSTWQEGVKLAQAAGADKLMIFHHSPLRSDKELEKIEKLAQAAYSKAAVAREGMVINL